MLLGEGEGFGSLLSDFLFLPFDSNLDLIYGLSGAVVRLLKRRYRGIAVHLFSHELRCQFAVALLERTPAPTDTEIDNAMINICRCGTYGQVRKAIHRASKLATKG